MVVASFLLALAAVRRRVAMLAALAIALAFGLGGCGSPADLQSPNQGGGGSNAHEHEHPHAHEDAGSPGDPNAGDSAQPRAADSSVPDRDWCLELGDALVRHACQHATIGPHTRLLAAAARELAPPDVHASHTPFRIRLPAQTIEFAADGWVRYRPSRGGRHVFFVGPKVDVRVIAAGSQQERPRLHEQPIERCPDALDHGFVYELDASAVYWIAFRQQSIELALFIEHAETFGTQAFRNRCPD